VIFHSFFGLGMYLENHSANALNSFSTSRALSEERYIPPELLQEFVRRGFLVQAGKPEREEIVSQYGVLSPEAISGLCLNMATGCNFRCHHCIHFAGSDLNGRPLKPGRMSFETARSAMDWVASGLLENGQTRMDLNFGGGEPLLNWRAMEKTLKYAHQHLQPRLDVHFSINTNASLMTSQMARALKKYNVRVIASLDGAKTGNDLVRRTKSGRPTFDLVQTGFARLAAAGTPVRAVHVILSSENFDSLGDTFIQYLAQRKMLSITLEPDLTDRLKQPVSSLVNKIMNLKKAAREKGISITGYWERPFARIIRPEADLTPHFCRAMGGKTIDVMPDGSLYSCSYTDLKLGNLWQFAGKGPPSLLTNTPRFRAMLDSQRIGQIDQCRGCELEGVCGGGCYATTAHALKKKDDRIIAYRCDFYRQVTRQLLLDAMDQKMAA